jgi:Restriction endonuclease
MAVTTRTFGSLHFEDLEPRRFEDLVRQLVYDFRPWRALEATGRSGSDEGFDARGFEITNLADVASTDNDDDDETVELGSDRLWLVQCKREQTITPGKITKHLSEIPDASTDGLYGVIFVAACDFSKRTRDTFRE